MAHPAPTYPVDPATETAEARAARIAWERARIAEAEEDITAGRYIEGEDAIRWLENELAEAEDAFEHAPE